MNNNIDERAIAWSEQHRDIYMCNADVIAELSYKQGATEQKQIDDEEYRKDMQYVNIKKQELIDRACKWLNNKYENGYVILTENTIENFRKAMEQ